MSELYNKDSGLCFIMTVSRGVEALVLQHPLKRPARCTLLWFNCRRKSITQQAFLVEFGKLFRAYCGNGATAKMRGEHNAFSLCLREVIDRVEQYEDNIVHFIVVIVV